MDENTTSINETLINPDVIKHKKKHRFLKFLLGLVLFIAIVIFSLNMALPGLITTRDLGVKYSAADYDSALSKLTGIKELLASIPNSANSTYGATKELNVTLNSAEITAFINTNNPVNYLTNNCQVLINNDGTIETSASVNVAYFLSEILDNKISKDQITKEIPALGMIPTNVNLYMKFTGEIVDNKSDIALQNVAVQGITIPNEYINADDAVSTLTSGIDSFIAKNNAITGTSIDSLKASDGKVNLLGKFPSNITTK